MKSNLTLLIDESDKYYLEQNNELVTMGCLPYYNLINIFIGTNNSGKSQFMRHIMSTNEMLILNEIYFSMLYAHVKHHNRSHSSKISLTKNNKIQRQLDSFMHYSTFNNFQQNNYYKEISVKKYYIPTLRTAHTLFQETEDVNSTKKLQKIEDDIFYETIKHNYNLYSKNIEVFTGIHLHKEILNARNSKKEKRKLFENFEKFISENFFDSKSVDIIAEFDKDESRKGNNTKEIISIHIEGEKHSRDLHHLGDGIQALIILMYKIFMAEDNAFIFIDEPEINLHPGMQRLFLEQITSNPDLIKKRLTYFISTHSNHFLDLTLDEENISIYSFRTEIGDDEEKKLIVKNVNAGDNDILKNIGVNNSSVFMANCSLWVEGISDRIYIKSFLKSYCDYMNVSYPKEDIDFAFFEYAGSNLDHYFFDDDIEEDEEDEVISNIKAMSLSNRIFLLADSDNVRENSSKAKRLEKLQSSASDNFSPKIIESHREIENLLTNEVWEKLLINLCNKKIVGKNEGQIKNKIKEALTQINSQDYKEKYIGEFLNSVRNSLGEISNTYILNKSEYKSFEGGRFGTLENKRALSEAFAKQEFSWDILSKNPQIEELTIEIFDFIKNR
ncbi:MULTISPECIES: AAA family ATPase [Chryseobacterium]|uniref:Uncharacterized conserved protein n=1 Tax=Chryseobacterium taihuense TaxID=1141221 RepID=A0A4U8WHQ2_9FLAO|nr:MULTISPECIES: AAA family ATPase [Chryseobacterium]QQV01230.1 AAA family ATPase [Chryseobacterium sp. FDAARGOS 1104]VFB02178.1 Uncharacterized conserved protein [Chryseobacterium taihuense]